MEKITDKLEHGLTELFNSDNYKNYLYLADINEQAQNRLQIIISQMQKAESVTEKMKEDNQWEWIQRMGSIHYCAEEIVLNKLTYR